MCIDAGNWPVYFYLAQNLHLLTASESPRLVQMGLFFDIWQIDVHFRVPKVHFFGIKWNLMHIDFTFFPHSVKEKIYRD